MSHINLTQRMMLCGGLQSGGTTILSWCFLQRKDTDGVLDMENDRIRVSFEKCDQPVVWCKMTVGSFRWVEVYDVYRDLGWEPEPILIVRDVRAVLASLMRKSYGFNGTTAENPPLRVRFRRYLQDWELFRSNHWPIIKYEDFVTDWSTVLKRACQELRLPWDEGMSSWPKKIGDIAYVHEPNETFMSSLASGDSAAAVLKRSDFCLNDVPSSELRWLEKEFFAYNEFHGYPLEVASTCVSKMPPPCYEGTARHWCYFEIDRLRNENYALSEKLQALGRA